ncbi:hypothetical protein [uncultured Aquimarina sp.]|uniref:hypothetical protein n=1 Tax=uncultured Aquimarina sp. TaxID=575652 RepID=UPI00262DF489|nr:hypothetical protein [uncultured Aquimarina sp.]
MLHKLLKLNGIQQLSKANQKTIHGGWQINPFNCDFGIFEACPNGKDPRWDPIEEVCKCGL